MPRRHRNARTQPDPDRLAAALTVPAPGLLAVCDGKFACAGCRKRGHWNGRYCPPCVGAIMLSARRAVLGR